MSEYSTAITERLGQLDVSATDTLGALLILLKLHHVRATGLEPTAIFDDGLRSVTGKHAASLAESIRNYALAESSRAEMDARLRSGDEAKRLRSMSREMRALAELVEAQLPKWIDDAEALRSKGFNRSENLLR